MCDVLLYQGQRRWPSGKQPLSNVGQAHRLVYASWWTAPVAVRAVTMLAFYSVPAASAGGGGHGPERVIEMVDRIHEKRRQWTKGAGETR